MTTQEISYAVLVGLGVILPMDFNLGGLSA